MRGLRQLSDVWRLALLVIGDIAVAIIAYELAWNIRTISSFGIFEAPLSKDGLVNVPHSYWAVVLSQIVLFSLAGLYRAKNFTPKRTLLRIPPILFLQMMFLGLLYRLSFLLQVPGFYPGPPSTFFSIFPVFWVLNSTFTSLWRTLTFYPGPLAAFFGKIGGRRDLTQILILGFIILLIPCAILLAFQAQKIGKAEKTAEEIANVGYSLLVLGVGMRLISMIRRKKND